MKPEDVTAAFVEEHLIYQDLGAASAPLWREFLLSSVKWMTGAAQHSTSYAVQVLSHPLADDCRTRLQVNERVLRWVQTNPVFVARPVPGEPQKKPGLAFGFLEWTQAPFCPWCMRLYRMHMQFLVIPRGSDYPEGLVVTSRGNEIKP